MTLNELITRLAELQAEGYGDKEVFYDYDMMDMEVRSVSITDYSGVNGTVGVKIE